MRKVTLSYPIRDRKALLARKKARFGAGMINGFGGEVEDGETPEEAAVREVREEVSLIVSVEHLIPAGVLKFFFEDTESWDHEVHIFLVTSWSGNPVESEEMDNPTWYDFDALPFESMWPADRRWVPEILRGKRVSGNVYFSKPDEEKKVSVKKYDVVAA